MLSTAAQLGRFLRATPDVAYSADLRRHRRIDARPSFQFVRSARGGRYVIGGGQGVPLTVAGADVDDVDIVITTGSAITGSVSIWRSQIALLTTA